MTTTETALETPTKTLYLYGKNDTLRHPTKAYPHATIVKLTAELIKDFGEGVIVWKFSAYKEIEPEKYWVYHHHDSGAIGTGGECESKETAFARAESALVWHEYTDRRKELYREFNQQLKELEAEYKGRI